jgi:hypothetical protein
MPEDRGGSTDTDHLLNQLLHIKTSGDETTMAQTPLPRETLSPDEMENIRVGYQVAVNLWIFFGELIWAKYNAMLVVNGIVAAAIGIVLTSTQPLAPSIMVGLSIIGLILCTLWAQLLSRGRAYLDPYISAARELEDRYLGILSIIRRGNEFNAGKTVLYEIDGKSVSVGMGFPANKVRTGQASYLIIAVFALMYALMLAMALRR